MTKRAPDWTKCPVPHRCDDQQTCRGDCMRDEPPTPAPAASDELVGRLRLRAKMPPDHYKTTFDIEEAADHIEADAAEMERKDARIVELIHEREEIRSQFVRECNRATAAEAERDALRGALGPFAKLAGEMFRDGGRSDYEDDRTFWGFNSVDLTYGDLRRVRAALRPEAKGGREDVG